MRLIVTSNTNVYTDGIKKAVLHKSELVEAIAGLRSWFLGNEEKQHGLRTFLTRFDNLDEMTTYSLRKYGEKYAGWLLIMDIATYISCKHYSDTGETCISFKDAMAEYDEMDMETYIYIFLGMPALGYEKKDASIWLKDIDTMTPEDIETIGQYIKEKDVRIFIQNIKELKDDLKNLLWIYWEKVFRNVWIEIEDSIEKTIDAARHECVMLGEVTQYLANVHKDIKISRGNIYIQKDVPYCIALDKINEVHIFPSTFTGEELLVDIFDDSLIIYYNLNLLDTKHVGEDGKRLCKIFKALGDDTRLKIIKMLWGAPATTQYLASMLGMSPSTVSSHLRVLTSIGFLTNKAIKKYVYYELNQDMVVQLGDELVGYLKK